MGNGSWVGSLLGQDRVEQRGKNSQTPGRPPEVGGGGGGGPAAPPDHRSRHRSRRKKAIPNGMASAGPTGVVYGGYIRTFPFFPDCFAVSSRKLPVPRIRSADIPTASQAS